MFICKKYVLLTDIYFCRSYLCGICSSENIMLLNCMFCVFKLELVTFAGVYVPYIEQNLSKYMNFVSLYRRKKKK